MLYLSSLRHGSAAVRSAAAIDHPVASLEKAQAQRAPEVPSPKDAQRLLLRCSCGIQRRQRDALLHLSRHAAQAVRHGNNLTLLQQHFSVNADGGPGSGRRVEANFPSESRRSTWMLF